MSKPYRLSPSRLPAPPHPTPTSVSGYTLPNPKATRAPISNPYDKFTQPEFDAWIGDITTSLKRALGHDEGPPRTKETDESTVAPAPGGDIPQYHPIDLPDESDNDVVDDSFAEFKARRAVGKGKARDPREGPGFGKSSVAQPIEIPSSDEEEEEEVEYSVLLQEDSESDYEAEQDQYEVDEEDEDEYPWSQRERPAHIASSPPSGPTTSTQAQEVARDEEYEEDEEEEAEYEEYDEDAEAQYEEYDEDEEAEGEVEQHEQGRREAEVIELLSDDDEPEVPVAQASRVQMEYDEGDEEEYNEEDEVYEVADAEDDGDEEHYEDEDEDDAYNGHPMDAQRHEGDIEYEAEYDEDRDEEVQPLEDDTSFPPPTVEHATTVSRRATSVEIPDPWNGPRVYAQDYYSGGEVRESSERWDPSFIGPTDEVDDEIIEQIPHEPEQAEEEIRHMDASNVAVAETPETWGSAQQRTNYPVFLEEDEPEERTVPTHADLHRTRSSASPFRELSFEREQVGPAEDHYIQPSNDDTSFPMQTEERDDHIVQIPDPWEGPREFAQDFYAGGDIRAAPGGHLQADHLAPEDEDRVEEVQARMEQEAEDDEIQPQERDIGFLHDDARAGAVQISDPWQGPETYAEDYYSGGINGALPDDLPHGSLLSVPFQEDDGYSSFLTPDTRTPSQLADQEAGDSQAEEQEDVAAMDEDRFALPPAPEGIYVPPIMRARDAPIPADAEIFTIDDSDDEAEGNPVPITEYTQDEHPTLHRASDEELQHVDEMYIGLAEPSAPAAEVQSEHVPERSAPDQEKEVLYTPEERKEVFASLVDWNNPPAFPAGLAASASGHMATPSEDEDLAVPEAGIALGSKPEDAPDVTQDKIALEREPSPLMNVDVETSAAVVDTARDVVPSVGLPEDVDMSSAQEPEQPFEQPAAEAPEQAMEGTTINSNDNADSEAPVDSTLKDTVDDTLELHQSVAETDPEQRTEAEEVQDEEPNVAHVGPIVEEVLSRAVSRAGTAPLNDLTLEELEDYAVISEQRETRLVSGIVEPKEATASPRETPERDSLTVEVIEEHTEHTFVSHISSPPPISTVLRPARYDDISYEEYASSVEVDELDDDQDEAQKIDEGVPLQAPLAQVDTHLDDNSLSVPSVNTVFSTNAQSVQDSHLPSAVAGEEDDEPPLDSIPGSVSNGIMVAGPTEIPAGKVSPARESSPSPPGKEVLEREHTPDDLGSYKPDDAHNHGAVYTPTEERPGMTPGALTSDIKTPEADVGTTDRYTPSPPKSEVSQHRQDDSSLPYDISQHEPQALDEDGEVVWTQEDLEHIAQAISPVLQAQAQPMSPTNNLSSPSRELSSPPRMSLDTPPTGPRVFFDSQLEQLRTQYAASINASFASIIANANAPPTPPGAPGNQQSPFSQTPLLHPPFILEQSRSPMPAASSQSWPYSLSAPSSAPVSPSPKGWKNDRASASPSKSPRKWTKSTKADKPDRKEDEANMDLQHPVDADLRQPAHEGPSDSTPGPTTVASKTTAEEQLPSACVDLPADDSSMGLNDSPVKEELSLPEQDGHQSAAPVLPTTTADAEGGSDQPQPAAPLFSTTNADAGGSGHKQKQSPQKAKKPSKRKRDMSPDAGDSKAEKVSEKKPKRPSKRKSKLLDLESPSVAAPTGEIVNVKAIPKEPSPPEIQHASGPSNAIPSTKESGMRKPKKALSAEPTLLTGAIRPQVVPDITPVMKAGQSGIPHNHGSSKQQTAKPAAPSFRLLPPRNLSPKKQEASEPVKPSVTTEVSKSTETPSISTHEAPAPTGSSLSTVTAPIPSVTPITATSELPSATQATYENSTAESVKDDASIPQTTPNATLSTLPPLSTKEGAQPSEVKLKSPLPETPSNTSSTLPVPSLPTEVRATPPATGHTITTTTPSAPVASTTSASVGRSVSYAGTPRSTARETRSSCRYHRISLPKEEGGPRVRFVVPGCCLTNYILMKEKEIEDHGLAPMEDAYVMTKDIAGLELDPELIKTLRVLVGHDIFDDQQLYYLPSPDEQLTVAPAFRRPTPSDKPDPLHRDALSPSYSNPAGSSTRHKSSGSVAGSTSSLSLLRNAQASEYSSNFAPTDSEEESDDDTKSPQNNPPEGTQVPDSKGKGKSRAKAGRKSKLSRDPDFVPVKEEEKVSGAEEDVASTRKRRKPTGSKRGVKRTRTEAPVGDESSHRSKKLKANPSAPPSLPSPEKSATTDAPPAT